MGYGRKKRGRYKGTMRGHQPVGTVSPEEYPIHGDADFWKQGMLDALNPERGAPEEWAKAFSESPLGKDEAAFNGMFAENGRTLSGQDAVKLAMEYQEKVLRKYGYEGPIDGKLGPLSLAAEQRRRAEMAVRPDPARAPEVKAPEAKAPELGQPPEVLGSPKSYDLIPYEEEPRTAPVQGGALDISKTAPKP